MTDPDEGYLPDWSKTRRPRGAWIFLLLIFLGLLPAMFYFWREPQLRADHAQRLADAPTTLEGRIEAWLVHGGPMIHHRIANVARISDEHPWIVTHRVDLGDGAPPEVWGIDTELLPRDMARLEGHTVVVELPAPRLLARLTLTGYDASKVPTYTDRNEVPDPAKRLQVLAFWFLERLPQALEKDIEGARLEVRVVAPEAAPLGG